jgi:hypothetical protein
MVAAGSLTVELPMSRRNIPDYLGLTIRGGTIFKLSPASRDYGDAERWLAQTGGGSDGVIANRLEVPYQGGNRDGCSTSSEYALRNRGKFAVNVCSPDTSKNASNRTAAVNFYVCFQCVAKIFS